MSSDTSSVTDTLARIAFFTLASAGAVYGLTSLLGGDDVESEEESTKNAETVISVQSDRKRSSLKGSNVTIPGPPPLRHSKSNQGEDIEDLGLPQSHFDIVKHFLGDEDAFTREETLRDRKGSSRSRSQSLNSVDSLTASSETFSEKARNDQFLDDMLGTLYQQEEEKMEVTTNNMKVGITSDTTCNQEGVGFGGSEEEGCCGGQGGDGGCCNDTAPQDTGCCGGKSQNSSKTEGSTCCSSPVTSDEGNLSLPKPMATDPKKSPEELITQMFNSQPSHPSSSSTSKPGAVENQHFLPGQAAVWLRTFGCSHNISDSEVMLGLLNQQGYKILSKDSDLPFADVIIVNSCSVKNPSQDAAVNLVRKHAKAKKPVILTGCVSQADPKLVEQLEKANVSIVGLSYTDKIVLAVESVLMGNRCFMIDFLKNPMTDAPKLPSLMLPKVRKNKWVEIIAINTGCLGSCTYCKTKMARGDLRSYPVAQIVDRVIMAFSEGVQQIWLTSEDTGAYGLDLPTDGSKPSQTTIVTLLNAVVPHLPPHGMLRLGMTNPPYMAKHAKKIAKILAHDNVFEFLHVPVQSGCDKILHAMNREYTSQVFSSMCSTLLNELPKMTLATDIICGFPGEKDASQERTVELLEKFKFPVVNISQFYARPGTPAAGFKDKVDSVIVKKRSREVTERFLDYETNGYLLEDLNSGDFDKQKFGTHGIVGFDPENPGKLLRKVWFSDTEHKKQQTVGHTKQHVKVVVPRDDLRLLGKVKVCRFISASKWHVVGEVVEWEGY